MKNTSRNKTSAAYKIRPAEKRIVDRAAKKIVKNYGKTLKLLAKE